MQYAMSGNNGNQPDRARRDLLKMGPGIVGASGFVGITSGQPDGKGKSKSDTGCRMKILEDTEEFRLTKYNCKGGAKFYYTDKERQKVEEVSVDEGEMAQVRSSPKSAVKQFEANSIVEEYRLFTDSRGDCSLPGSDKDMLIGGGFKFEKEVNEYASGAIGGALCAIPQFSSWLRIIFGGSCSALGVAITDYAIEDRFLGVGFWDGHGRYYVPYVAHGLVAGFDVENPDDDIDDFVYLAKEDQRFHGMHIADDVL